MRKTTSKSIATDGKQGSKAPLTLLLLLLGAGLIAGGFWLSADSVLNKRVVEGESDYANNLSSPTLENRAKTLEPVRINIPSLKISTNVSGLDLNRDGILQVPKDPFEVGWYQRGPLPGNGGTALFVGHLDSETGRAIFWDLKKLKTGDLVEVERGDGTKLRYKVNFSTKYSQDSFPWDRVYSPEGESELRLITCTGTYNRKAGHYSENLVVFATRA